MDTRSIIDKLGIGGAWIFHTNCTVNWFTGPFESVEKAREWAEKKLVDKNSCPGCGKGTPPPVGAHYTIFGK